MSSIYSRETAEAHTSFSATGSTEEIPSEEYEMYLCNQELDNTDTENHHGEDLPELSHTASNTVVAFAPDDPDNANNWTKSKKMYILAVGIMQVINSTMGSSICSGATEFIGKYFNITNQEELVLPVSVFLIGYIFGPLLWGPSSEAYGRKLPLVIGFIMFTIFMMACAVANSFASLLVFRLLDGVAASAPIAVVGGLFADIHNDPTKRGRTMAYYMACTTFGPVIGPWVSGFVSVYSWRWSFWIGLICAGLTMPLVLFMPETYGPVILQRRAKKLRKETGDNSIVAPLDEQNRDFKKTLAVILSRPFRMIAQEAIVSLTCLYLSLAYAIFYLYFQAYPIIFQGIYKMSPGIAGLCFLPIAVGAVFACLISIWYDNYLSKAKARNAAWSQIEEYRRLPLACIGGPLYVGALFWIGWTASPNIHWAVPMLSGLPFGIGFLLIFMCMLNYLADAYETFSASALSAASCCRSIMGAVLPLAAKPMFERLGVHWACSLIAFLSLGVSVIPFAFIRFGDRIRANSRFCQELQEMKRVREQGEAGEASGRGNAEDLEK